MILLSEIIEIYSKDSSVIEMIFNLARKQLISDMEFLDFLEVKPVFIDRYKTLLKILDIELPK